MAKHTRKKPKQLNKHTQKKKKNKNKPKPAKQKPYLLCNCEEIKAVVNFLDLLICLAVYV